MKEASNDFKGLVKKTVGLGPISVVNLIMIITRAQRYAS